MNDAATNSQSETRRLRPADLEQVIAIDSHHFGQPRRGFFEKRLAQAKQHPEDYVQVGIDRNGVLVGFAFACILRGEFGREQTTATLDAVGVVVSNREQGVGHALMDGLAGALRRQGVKSLQSQAGWANHGLLRFFDASGFGLAPRLVLERTTLTPLPEAVDAE
ncbi:GNAT family N-acetyltransferase [Bradyrhizobium sp.]|uniref:GNAT family N-acetyltransferase n=1 Tax=Bradyrhizobium sp. TaxID=376 RepID=UPI002386508A|nr:GNAT family N-acetyltransferase [Bradyrhizobium sp.]MDE2376074.1 GNAT family N-acetyltransferase [Bradyrhizobium sp.]